MQPLPLAKASGQSSSYQEARSPRKDLSHLKGNTFHIEIQGGERDVLCTQKLEMWTIKGRTPKFEFTVQNVMNFCVWMLVLNVIVPF